MKLERIRLAEFRRFHAPLEITGIDEGLNLFVGPNESGKSTIVEAIRAAFFERHRASTVKDFLPAHDSAATPTVELDFTLHGEAYRLVKSFLNKPRCDLRTPSGTLASTDAEDHLAELLGFHFKVRGASSEEQWGIPGLLWVRQGEAHTLAEPIRHAKPLLQGIFDASVGEVASTGGEALLARVLAERDELLSRKQGNPKGPYKELIERVTALSSELREVEEAVARYAGDVDRLAALRREHARDEQTKPWKELRRKQLDAQTKLDAIDARRRELSEKRSLAEATKKLLASLDESLARLAHDERDLRVRRENAHVAAESLERVATRAGRLRVELDDARRAYDEARGALESARRAEARSRLASELVRAHDERARVEEALARAERAWQRRVDLGAKLAEIRIEVSALNELRACERERRELTIRLGVAATELRFALEPGRHLVVDDETVAGEGKLRLTAPTRIVVDGLGALEILPGGRDLEALHRKEREIDAAFDAKLREIGVASLDDAEQRHRSCLDAESELESTNVTLHALAPKGLEELREHALASEARIRELDARTHALGSPDEEAALPLADAEARAQEAEARFEHARSAWNESTLAEGRAQSELAAQTKEIEAATARLESPERRTHLLEQREARRRAELEIDALERAVAALDAEIRDAQPEILAKDVARYRASVEQLEEAHRSRRDALRLLEGRLEHESARGLDERRVALDEALARATRHRDELARRARALDHLHDVLVEKRQALSNRLREPLLRRLAHYSKFLFGESRFEIDDDFSPRRIERALPRGREELELDRLSFGAREQLGLVTRLAYADLLAESGRPTLLLLDDVLVHSDEARLEPMKRILYDAAERHQILLFSCHPERYLDLGVPARAIGALEASP